MTNRLPCQVVMPNGDLFVPVVIKIESTYEDGRPEAVTLLPDDVGVEVNRGDRFLIAYVKQELVAPRAPCQEADDAGAAKQG